MPDQPPGGHARPPTGEPVRYLGKAAVAQQLNLPAPTVATWHRRGQFMAPDVCIDTRPGWTPRRVELFGQWRRQHPGEAPRPGWWTQDTTQYLSYRQAAALLGIGLDAVHARARRGRFLRPQIVIGRAVPQAARRASTGVVHGELVGFDRDATIEYGRQEGLLDPTGQPRRRRQPRPT